MSAPLAGRTANVLRLRLRQVLNNAVKEGLVTSEPHSGSSAHSTPAADECRRLMDKLHAHSSANRRCADCASDQDISWCSINLAVLLCSKCSGAHRAMGCGVSKVSDRTQCRAVQTDGSFCQSMESFASRKVRSLILDTRCWTFEAEELLLRVGNQKANSVSKQTRNCTCRRAVDQL